MKSAPVLAALAAAALFCLPRTAAAGGDPDVFVAYHWHLHQPLYWPAPAPGHDRVQTAAESYDVKAKGGGFYPNSTVPHPENNLASGDIGAYDPVFSNDDRIAAYQGGGRDSIGTLSSYPDGGASISYTGSLMDNIQSFGKDNRFGYMSNWNSGYAQAMGWHTSGGFPKGDMIGITYHHALAPLVPPSVLSKELQIFKAAWHQSWGAATGGAAGPTGFFPPEVAFSEDIIPTLLAEGFTWSMIANGHLARTCANYLDKDVAPMHGTATWNTNPPNKADMSGPTVPANQWWSGTLDGRGAKLPAPYGYQAHWARHVDPATGAVQRLVVVPMDDVQSYMNGYASMGTDTIDSHVAPFADPAHPSIVLLAHDGDNAWGGGSSFYQESVPGLAQAATAKGYHMTTVQQFLASHPVPDADVVHVEDGPWINPEGDWGDPQFVKWLYPPARSPKDPAYNANDPRTFIDIEGGFSSSFRSWAVIIAGANLCETAEQILGPGKVQPAGIRFGGDAGANDAELCWHYYLPGLDSGFMYYGDSLDDYVKQSLALNDAAKHAQVVIGDGKANQTPPTMLRPQRWPYNPGGAGWGVTTGYKDIGLNGKPPHQADFYVWTLAHGVAGMASVTLYSRSNTAGATTPGADDFTYAGGATVGPWTATPMTKRVIDPTFTGSPPDPKLNYFILPQAIADEYWAKATGYRNVLVDYYVEAVDQRGNTNRSGISHVWVQDPGSAAGG